MNNRFKDYEKIPLQTYLESIGLSKDDVSRTGIMLYHGIRFDVINRLESIFQEGSILCGNRVNSSYKSYDGSTKHLYIDTNSDENCNMGKYISVMPYVEGVEFDTFIKSNIFLAIKSTIEAYKTIHLSYDDYIGLRKSGMNYKNLYSYAFNEYFIKNEISLDDVLYIGIDSRYYLGEYEKTVRDIKKLMEVYKIRVPLVDIQTYKELFCYNDKGQKMTKTK